MRSPRGSCPQRGEGVLAARVRRPRRTAGRLRAVMPPKVDDERRHALAIEDVPPVESAVRRARALCAR